ncbi:MAG: O-antigen ligase family protein [Ectothiorhodospiraceae bacterium]|nr:O-antigen ligase family protein [Ectothiorhodospiraceae bacterium]
MSATAPPQMFQSAKSRLESLTVPGIIFFVYCYFLIDYFGRLAARVPAYGMFRPTLLLVLILAVALFAQAHKAKDRLNETPIKIILLLLGYIFISFPLVEWPGSVLRNNIDPFIRSLSFLFFTAVIVDTDRRLKVFLLIFLGLQAFRILEPLISYLLTGELRGSTYVGGGQFEGRLGGSRYDVINANGLGFLIVSTLAFLHFLMFRSPSRLIRWLYLALVPLLMYALVLTSSRGALLTLLVLAWFVFWDSRNKFVLVTVVAISLVVGWSQMSDFHKERYLSLISDDTSMSGTRQGRIDGLSVEFRLGLKKPIFGHGLGTTSEAKVNQLGQRREAAHNLYAELLIEIGFIGALIFLAYLFSLHKMLRQNLRRFREVFGKNVPLSDFHYRLNHALFVVFWVYAVYSINYYGLSQDYWYVYGGLCIAFYRSLKRNEERFTTASLAANPQPTEAAAR